MEHGNRVGGMLALAGVCGAVWTIAGCGSTAATGRPAVRQTPAAPPVRCERAVAGIDALAAPGATVILGEVHGTTEVPRLVGDAVCQVSANHPVTLAIEQPRTEQAALDAFVASAGAAADRERLLSREFWTTNPYGISSRAMLEMIERVRAWRAAGRDVKVVAFDREWSEKQDEVQPRDAAMAELLIRVRAAEPDRVMIVLTGGYHARRTRGLPHDASFEPMAWHLVQRSIPLATFDVERAGGSFWACITTVTPDANKAVEPKDMHCGTHPFTQPVKQDARRWYLAPQPDIDGYDGVFGVGPTTASPPAVEPLRRH